MASFGSSATIGLVAAAGYYMAASLGIWIVSARMSRRPRMPPAAQSETVQVTPLVAKKDAKEGATETSELKHKRRLSFMERIQKSLYNPFFSPCWHATTRERFKMALLGPLLAPPRLLCAVGLMAMVGIVSEAATLGLPTRAFKNGIAEPLPLWRRSALVLVRSLARFYLFALGYYYIEEKGRPAPRSVAPIVVANHLGLLEPVYLVFRIGGMPVSRIENLKMPLFGAIGRIFQFICVDRADPESRKSVGDEIRRRAEDNRWRQILLFPEGTTTNGKAVVTFKTGAFAPRLPVQPVAVNFPYTPGGFHPGWVSAGPTLGEICLRMVCQPYNRMQVSWLPVVEPLASELEPAHPKAFAARVQSIIAAALGVPATEHSYEDVQLMAEAAKLSGDTKNALAANDSVVELGRLRRVLGVNVQDAKVYLARFRECDTNGSGRIDVREFQNIFGPSADPAVTERLFDILDEDGDGRLSFREYLVGSALFNAHDDATVRQAFQLGFALYDREDTGSLTVEDGCKLLAAVFPDGDLEATFREVDEDGDGKINEEEFLAWIERMEPDYEEVRNRLFHAASQTPAADANGAEGEVVVPGVADKEDEGNPGFLLDASGTTGLGDTGRPEAPVSDGDTNTPDGT